MSEFHFRASFLQVLAAGRTLAAARQIRLPSGTLLAVVFSKLFLDLDEFFSASPSGQLRGGFFRWLI